MIEPIDLKEAIQSLGYEPKNATIYHIFSWADRDCSGQINFDEFIDMVTDQMHRVDRRRDVEKLFRLFDDDRTGQITIANLKRIVKELGENVSDDELKDMIRRADTTGTGYVTFDDFYNILTT